MIPKIIHYCWFGRGKLPKLAKKCIKSWKKYYPDYEIKEWNEDNFDVNIIPYTREAYIAGKYAFVSDYARFWILYHYGGIYFDTDVEAIAKIDDIVARGAFMACENELKSGGETLLVAPGLGLGAPAGLTLYKELLDVYKDKHFLLANGCQNTKTVVEYTTELLVHHGLQQVDALQCVDGIYVYPKEYFCPLSFWTGKCEFTDNTRTIHHYCGSWMTKEQLMRKRHPRLFKYWYWCVFLPKYEYKKYFCSSKYE